MRQWRALTVYRLKRSFPRLAESFWSMSNQWEKWIFVMGFVELTEQTLRFRKRGSFITVDTVFGTGVCPEWLMFEEWFRVRCLARENLNMWKKLPMILLMAKPPLPWDSDVSSRLKGAKSQKLRQPVYLDARNRLYIEGGSALRLHSL